MRRVALGIGHGLLILVLIAGLFTSIIAVVERFDDDWTARGLLPLLLLVAAEAMITQRLIARERRTLGEQLSVRGLELLVIVLLARAWSLAAQDQSLISSVSPWLREPLRFFDGRFAEYFLWCAGPWVIAAVLSADVLGWQGDAHLGAFTESSIEREQLQQEWDQSVARFRRRFLGITVVTLVVGAVALHGLGLAGTRVPNSARIIAADIMGLVAGLLLLSAGRLNQLRHHWSADRIDVDAGIGHRWGRSGFLLVLGLVLLAPTVSWLVLFAPPPPLVPIANALLWVMTIIVSLAVLVIGLLLSPLILLLALIRGQGGRPESFAMPRFEPPQIVEGPTERPLLPALIFWGCVALLVLIGLVRYVRGRSDLRAAIGRWRLVQWLRRIAGEWGTDARGWAALAAATVLRLARGRSPRTAAPRPRGIQAELRALYWRMRAAALRGGVPQGAAQTPYEFSAELGRALPGGLDDVQGLTDTYVVAEYGPQPAGRTELRRARRHWRRLQRWLPRSGTLRRAQRGMEPQRHRDTEERV